jgi:hypothetical protein
MHDMPWDQNDPGMEMYRASDIVLIHQPPQKAKKEGDYDECECGNRKEKRAKTCAPCYHERQRSEHANRPAHKST